MVGNSMRRPSVKGKGNNDDGKQKAQLYSAREYVTRRPGSGRSLLSACGENI
jgi:hypothetical protein